MSEILRCWNCGKRTNLIYSEYMKALVCERCGADHEDDEEDDKE